MLAVYSLLLAVAFVLMSPLFIMRRAKYAAGFSERMGTYPAFEHDGRPVIWLHCVSVGETNAARPLFDSIKASMPDYRVVISTTTRTGQELAKEIFAGRADAVVYFPFDFAFSVRRALRVFQPSVVLLMETEIWPRFIHEARRTRAKVAIVNGRLSQRSFDHYIKLRSFVASVLSEIDVAAMQSDIDVERIEKLGLAADRVVRTGNIKFDLVADDAENELTEQLRGRFGIIETQTVIVAASTHDPEERAVIEAFENLALVDGNLRLFVAPRHPDRFERIAELLNTRTSAAKSWARRSHAPQASDRSARIVLLDSIGELRSVYPLADIVFVGGSLIPHGGQSILEPAAAGKAIFTGPHTFNFEAVVSEFLERKAIIQLPAGTDRSGNAQIVYEVLKELIEVPETRRILGSNALAAIRANRGATARTLAVVEKLVGDQRLQPR